MSTLSARLPHGLPAFLVVGAIGFGVDAAAFAFLIHAHGFEPYFARLISFAIAVTATYALNRSWSFRQRAGRRRGSEYGRYLAVQIVGVAINFAVFAGCIELSRLFEAFPTLALALGSILAMGWNYAGARMFVFRGLDRSQSA